MTWNYRVIQKTVEFQGEDYQVHAIHEVYYDTDGNIDGWTLNPIELSNFEDCDDLKGSLELIQKAFEKPALREVEEEGKDVLKEVIDLKTN